MKKKLIQKILLFLDTSDANKISVPSAIELAKKLNTSITLFSMAQSIYTQNIDSIEIGIAVKWDSIDAATKKYTDEYLQRIQDEIRRSGFEVNHISNVSVDAAHEILDMEKKIQPDLVVMATKGRSNIARWALGSVAEKVLHEGNRPVLMIKEGIE